MSITDIIIIALILFIIGLTIFKKYQMITDQMPDE